jgi:hypothetical protein
MVRLILDGTFESLTHYVFWQGERKKRKLGGGDCERHYRFWGVFETKFAVLKVPRQCPLVLLVWLRLVCGIR